GPAGPAGPPGPEGPAGPEGPPGPTVTENSMFAANTAGDTIDLVIGTALVPLPDGQNLDGFTPDAANEVFTVPEAGRYYISYKLNTTLALALQTVITVNGAPIEASRVNPPLALSNFSADVIVDLAAGDEIALQVEGIGSVTLQDGVGASLTVIRVE
ncbi:MAG: collagen-like triple helix repeat-containing protein, partial [Tissierellia bacterium]|nr:collagen-like triple helix repeat-containing protein [Tissierellia bacterium]